MAYTSSVLKNIFTTLLNNNLILKQIKITKQLYLSFRTRQIRLVPFTFTCLADEKILVKFSIKYKVSYLLEIFSKM